MPIRSWRSSSDLRTPFRQDDSLKRSPPRVQTPRISAYRIPQSSCSAALVARSAIGTTVVLLNAEVVIESPKG
jgi:hypothetical protein